MSVKQVIKDSAPAWILNWVLPAYRVIRRWYVSSRTRIRCLQFTSYLRPIRIELGPGMIAPPPGWLTVDLTPSATFYCDLRAALPFPSQSVDEIYSSHVLEHFTLPQLKALIAECRRVLTPGGVFNAAVPNGGMFIRAYCDAELRKTLIGWVGTSADCQLGTPLDVVNHMAHLGGEHRYVFDEENVVALLKMAGLVDVRLRDFDPHRDVHERRHESIYVIGFSPNPGQS